MTHLLNLLAAIALLVWGTHLVRTGILRVLGANLGSGLLALLTTLNASVQARQVHLGNLVFKLLVGLICMGLTPMVARWPRPRWQSRAPCARPCTRSMWWKPCCWACWR